MTSPQPERQQTSGDFLLYLALIREISGNIVWL